MTVHADAAARRNGRSVPAPSTTHSRCSRRTWVAGHRHARSATRTMRMRFLAGTGFSCEPLKAAGRGAATWATLRVAALIQPELLLPTVFLFLRPDITRESLARLPWCMAPGSGSHSRGAPDSGASMSSFKRSQAKYVKQTHKIANWPAYESSSGRPRLVDLLVHRRSHQ